jgi:hypothetical protein
VVISVTEERSLASNRKEQVARKLEFLEQEEELIEEEIADARQGLITCSQSSTFLSLISAALIYLFTTTNESKSM